MYPPACQQRGNILPCTGFGMPYLSHTPVCTLSWHFPVCFLCTQSWGSYSMLWHHRQWCINKCRRGSQNVTIPWDMRNTNGINWHTSLQSGGANVLSLSRYLDHEIQKMGWWQSTTLEGTSRNSSIVLRKECHDEWNKNSTLLTLKEGHFMTWPALPSRNHLATLSSSFRFFFDTHRWLHAGVMLHHRVPAWYWRLLCEDLNITYGDCASTTSSSICLTKGLSGQALKQALRGVWVALKLPILLFLAKSCSVI